MRVVRVEPEGLLPALARPAPEPLAPVDDPISDHALVMVTWHDAWFDFDQQDDQEPRADYLVHTVGFLLSEGPRFISLAQEVLPDGDGFRAVTHIPLAIVESVTSLGPYDEVEEPPAG